MKSKTIEPENRMGLINYIKLIWDYRSFSRSLAVGDIKNKYARTFTGVFLSLIHTLIGLSVYWLIFGVAIGINTGIIPYPLFVLPGLISWQYFTQLTTGSANALFQSEHLISKLYFPRINLILAKILPGLLDFFLGFLVFFILFFAYQQPFTYLWLLLPLCLIGIIITGLALGLWTSILGLYMRDLNPIIIQSIHFLIFVTPVFYPGTIIPDSFKFILYLNPVAGSIEYMRYFLLGTELPNFYYFIGFILAFILLFTAVLYYKNIEKNITDLL